MHYKTRTPAANVPRFNDTVATDTFIATTPALNDGIPGHGGVTLCQIYCARECQLTQGTPMKDETEIPATLLEFIREIGAMNMLVSDNAKVAIGKAVKEILWIYSIKDHQSKPRYQHQNYAKRRIQELKRVVNQILDRSGAPPEMWLLCLLYVIYLTNRLAVDSLGGKSPYEAAFNQKPDTSTLLKYFFYQQVYYAAYDAKFPAQSAERSGRRSGEQGQLNDVLDHG
jgi:hypothetical protein